MSNDQSRLTWALILSVLLHGMMLSLLPLVRRAHLALPQPPAMLDVDVVPLPKTQALAKLPAPQAAPAAVPAPPAMPVPKQQIVSPSDQGEEQEPENARFLSDRNNMVKEEMVHRGEPAPGDPDSKQRAAEPKPQAPAEKAEAKNAREDVARKPAAESRSGNTQVAALPKLDQLLPPSDEMIRAGVVRPQEPESAAAAPEQRHATAERTDLLRHGDPWRGRGSGGSMDFLPAVRDGDITMLNTKADQFAPFVRRVAVRVFQNFVIMVRKSYASGQEAAEEYATVEAVMDKNGQVVAIETKRRSGSIAFATDRNLQAACREGFFDRNPPSGAETSDGKIHFIFDARVTLAMDAGGRRVPAWVLMGAGLL